jgi:hypothetical protein
VLFRDFAVQITLDVMKKLMALVALLLLVTATGVAGYRSGQIAEAVRAEIQETTAYAATMQALRPALSSSDEGEVERALWLTLGELRAAERRPSKAMPSDLARIEIAITYARLSELGSKTSEAKAALLMKHALAACQAATSPNCSAEALTQIVRGTQTARGTK